MADTAAAVELRAISKQEMERDVQARISKMDTRQTSQQAKMDVQLLMRTGQSQPAGNVNRAMRAQQEMRSSSEHPQETKE
ncbi:hypothetical protein P4204_09820 [Pseudomonas aeruginosa]|nr:hypothetical protein [Pseudomonas aeruginosa]